MNETQKLVAELERHFRVFATTMQEQRATLPWLAAKALHHADEVRKKLAELHGLP